MKRVVGGMFVMFSLLAGCATSGGGSPHGAVVLRGGSAKAVVTGPALVRAYSTDRGGSIFIAPAVTGTDADCMDSHAAAANAKPIQIDRKNVVTLDADHVACVTANGHRAYELLWRSAPQQNQSRTGLLAQGRR